MIVEGINHSKTITNHVPETFKVLGIEATRQALLNEMRVVLGAYGIYINYRHLSLLCDTMTVRGYIMPINRNGINRIDCGPLRKCSFEETLDMALEAALFSTVDQLTGISENVLLGQLCRLGSGCFDLVMDKDKLKDPKYIPDRTVEIEAPQSMASEIADRSTRAGDRTPFIEGTPHPGSAWRNSTPGRDLDTPRLDEFTPYIVGGASPSYMINPAATPGRSPSYLKHTSPRYSPIASPGLAISMNSPYPASANSPGYSPSNSVTYNPTSPVYNVSNSPSVSSSGGAGTRSKIVFIAISLHFHFSLLTNKSNLFYLIS